MPEVTKEKQIAIKNVIMLTTALLDERTKPTKIFPTSSPTQSNTIFITRANITTTKRTEVSTTPQKYSFTKFIKTTNTTCLI